MGGEIGVAKIEDVVKAHYIMQCAFEEYRFADIPSSALEESVESIANAITKQEEQIIMYMEDGISKGMVRFKIMEGMLYFFRLSVVPEARNKGIAKKLISWLEMYAKDAGLNTISCTVRKEVPKNVQLYESLGYVAAKEENICSPSGRQVAIFQMEKKI